MKPKLIVIGGFLGAGKTTLLRAVARRLTQLGHTVGLITNDQAPDLVDTTMLTGTGMNVIEVSGSCFCCNFPGFESAIQSLIEAGADMIVAEPVGSCTDLAATIMQPLKNRRPDIDLAPLTVLASPDHVREALRLSESGMHENAVYILGLQMAEADHLLLNKVDLLTGQEVRTLSDILVEAFPEKALGPVSARTGFGIDAWLAKLFADGEVGKFVLDVDYDRYAEGEAVLGWLNAAVELQSGAGPVDFLQHAMVLMEALHQTFCERSAEIGHVKAVVESNGEQRVANLTNLRGQVTAADPSPLLGSQARLILNARVQMPAEELKTIGRSALDRLGSSLRVSTTAFRCLTPGRPQPTHRYPALEMRAQE